MLASTVTAYNSRNLDTIAELFSDDVVATWNGQLIASNRQQLRAWFAAGPIGTAEHFAISKTLKVASKDTFAVQWRYDVHGPDGDRVGIGLEFWSVRDGVVDCWDAYGVESPHSPAAASSRELLGTDFLCEMRIQLGEPIDCGDTGYGRRTAHMVTSGTVTGPRVRGRILPGSGGDWAHTRPDGSASLDVRICLRTDDGATIQATALGRMAPGAGDSGYALDFDKADDPAGAARYYFRTSYLFHTGDPRYAWLNNIVTAVRGRTGDGGVIYEVFALT